ncbi:PEP-CTERM sorting domain-containing protein [Accumulibacter sp.]|uniref:PEP-CTERM sorting domain-containing protein n=1 Tax=Accumulibacter sp. TaxID=2053492 RepID=UPI00261C7863|nr:PEP-CTERM sorting domain-containing protein [Accumulibacter sp.]
MISRTFLRASCLALGLSSIGLTSAVQAQTVSAPFAADYTLVDLAAVPSLPLPYGGLSFKAGDPNTILIGGTANAASGLLYQIGVVRGVDNHITGFSGSATAFGTVGAFNDGGVVYGPGGVLFTSQWPENKLVQTKPGSSAADKVIDLLPFGVAPSHAALNFVPAGFAGASQMKLVSWSGGQFYTAAYAPDGTGTFDISSVTQVDLDSTTLAMDTLPGGPEGFVYITAGNPGFVANAMLVSEFSAGNVVAYDLDGDGNPLVTTRRELITGLEGAEGAAIDPLTGDFLFSTFGTTADRIVALRGFTKLPPPLPEPASVLLFGIALAGLALQRRKENG